MRKFARCITVSLLSRCRSKCQSLLQATFAQRLFTALQELLNTSADAQRLLTMLERKVSEEIYHLAMRALSADLSHSIAS